MSPAALRVFLSRTSELDEHPTERSYRSAAEAAVKRAQGVVLDMNYSTAEPGSSADYCRRQLREADVYVGIIGFLYGSLVGRSPDCSYVEMEFELAAERKMDCLVFLLDPESGRLGLPATAINKQDAEHQRRQDSFRARLAQNDKRAFVESPDNLEILLYQALVAIRDNRLSREPPPAQPAGPDDSMLGLAGRAQQGWQDALAAAVDAERAIRRVVRQGVAAADIDEWDYADQQAVHKRLAASIVGPAAELESHSKRVFELAKDARSRVGRLRSAGFVQLASRLSPLLKSMSDFEQLANDLLDQLAQEIDDLNSRGCPDYALPGDALGRARENVEDAVGDASSALRGLRKIREAAPATGPLAAAPEQPAAEANLAWTTRETAREVTHGGKAAAGTGTLPSPLEPGALWLPRLYVTGDQVFTVQVRGDSMIGDGLRDGDYVIVDPREEERDGDIVVVVIGNQDEAEALVKRLYREGQQATLVSSNPRYPKRTLDAGEALRVAGKVTGIYRPAERLPLSARKRPAGGILNPWAGTGLTSLSAMRARTGPGLSGWPGSYSTPATRLSSTCGTGRRAATSSPR